MSKKVQIRNSTAEFLVFTEHLRNVIETGELDKKSVCRDFRHTAESFAESESEKYRIIQDPLFESDFDRASKQLPNSLRGRLGSTLRSQIKRTTLNDISSKQPACNAMLACVSKCSIAGRFG